MLKKNFDKITAIAAVAVFAVAVVLCASVSLDEGKDSVARITALAGLFFSSMTIVLRVWDSIEKVECIPTRHNHGGSDYFAVEVHNRGSVPVHVKEVQLRLNGGKIERLNIVDGKAILGPKESAIYSDTTERKEVAWAAKVASVIAYRPDDTILAQVKGSRLLEALSGRGPHLFGTMSRRGQLR